MKTIVYILIVVFIGSILLTAMPINRQESNKTIVLECVNKEANLSSIYITAEILKKRLDKLGFQEVEVKASKIDSTISVSFLSVEGLTIINDLLTVKGKLEFYETITRSEFLEIYGEKLKLIESMLIQDLYTPESILGYCNSQDKQAVQIEIDKIDGNNDYKLSWSSRPDSDGFWTLFILRNNSELGSEQVSEAQVVKFEESEALGIQITFNSEGAKMWQKITKRSIGRPVAITVDGKVYSAPMVRDEIKGGKSLISGNFTLEEASKIATLISIEQLPEEFLIVE